MLPETSQSPGVILTAWYCPVADVGYAEQAYEYLL